MAKSRTQMHVQQLFLPGRAALCLAEHGERRSPADKSDIHCYNIRGHQFARSFRNTARRVQHAAARRGGAQPFLQPPNI